MSALGAELLLQTQLQHH